MPPLRLLRSAPAGMTGLVMALHCECSAGADPGLQRILRCHPLAIGASGYGLNPGRVFQVPLDGFANAGFKSFLRTPTQFRLNLTGIHRISVVVPGTIGDKGDQLTVRYSGIAWTEFIEHR